jgi:peroxiredoxin
MSCLLPTILIEVLPLLQLSGSATSGPLSQNTNIMGEFFLIAIILTWMVVAVGGWLAWQVLRQNGRMLLRLEALEKCFEDLDLEGEPRSNGKSGSIATSRINRDGLRAGTVAPAFSLPRIDGGELSLKEFRGRRVLLIFSDPQCGPCNYLAPRLEKFHREKPEVAVLMISRREPKENRAKAKEHGLTFPVVLQKQWEISRLYGMFATPIAYLIDDVGIITNNVAVGVDSIVELMKTAAATDPRADMEQFVLTEAVKT